MGRANTAPAILARRDAEAAAAREERLSRGIDLEYVLSAETIEKLVKKGFVSAAADREPVTLSGRGLSHSRGGLNMRNKADKCGDCPQVRGAGRAGAQRTEAAAA